MDIETFPDLGLEQWEILKALRLPLHQRRRVDPLVLAQLFELGLAAGCPQTPAITERGRRVLIRGSIRLLDLAA